MYGSRRMRQKTYTRINLSYYPLGDIVEYRVRKLNNILTMLNQKDFRTPLPE
ncbi:hypothetical protein BAQU_0075 [Bifidobacterium aquikefiri]|uniref:Uncharacterized protein n=1 Tax=Bifidobacterium aquikefiri TaxID=1653207 RepID=A0A261GBJ7_9BIFI|nr:hypothetical protein BAQU_0075 [Bifidobacterium aquikefiri]